VDVLKLPHWVGYIVVQFAANAVNFLLHKFWAFQAGDLGRAEEQYVKQLLLFVVSLGLNTGLASLLSYRLHLSPIIALAISSVVVYLTWNYPGNRFWVFRRE
jgi:putative flippase GtrA